MLAIVALVPGCAAARVVPDFLTVGPGGPLSDGAPNLWALVQALPGIGNPPLTGLAMAMAIGAAAWLAAHFAARPPRGEAVLSAALLVALTLPGLLPQMRPQDFLLALLLSAMTSIRRRDPMVAALVVTGCVLAMIGFGGLGALPMIAATVSITRPFLASPANDNGLPINPVLPYPA